LPANGRLSERETALVDIFTDDSDRDEECALCHDDDHSSPELAW
jgi:hypothetical protein